MSHWAQVGVEIRDLGIFRRACEKHGLNFNEATLHLSDTHGGGTGVLDKTDSGYRLRIDTDPRYSSISRRLGSGAALLMRSYSEEVVLDTMVQGGNWLSDRRELEDGSLVLSICVNQ